MVPENQQLSELVGRPLNCLFSTKCRKYALFMLKLQGLGPRFVKIQTFAFGLSRVLASISLISSNSVYGISKSCMFFSLQSCRRVLSRSCWSARKNKARRRYRTISGLFSLVRLIVLVATTRVAACRRTAVSGGLGVLVSVGDGVGATVLLLLLLVVGAGP